MKKPIDKIVEHWNQGPEWGCIKRRLFEQKRTIVFTNGCFDLVGAHHARMLNFARDLGDSLVVVVNSDASVAAIKGLDRPIVPFADRAFVLASFSCVDLVIGFDEPSPVTFWEAVRPAILCKDVNTPPTQEESRFVGKVILCPTMQGRSTSQLLLHIQEVLCGKK